MKGLIKAWKESVDKKNSIVCAGVDPSESAMGRSDKGEGMPAGADKRQWALNYIEAVAPHVAAVKFNVRYFGRDRDLVILDQITDIAHELGLVVIQDSKEADIGSTNDAGIFYAAARGVDAQTVAAFAGNMQEAVKQGKDRKIDLISMCLMSSPDYKRIKNMWVDVSDSVADYDPSHIIQIQDPETRAPVPHARHYVRLANDAKKFGFVGIVIGAPSPTNHIQDSEVANASRYFSKEGLVLVPGIGAQGGEVPVLAKHFNPIRLVCNVGRGLMFPKGAYSTPKDQAEAAKQYQTMLNGLRSEVA